MNILGLGLPELVVIALILLLFFGPKRLPGLFRSIGTSVRELKDGLSGDSDKTDDDSTPKHMSSSTDAVTGDNDTNKST